MTVQGYFVVLCVLLVSASSENVPESCQSTQDTVSVSLLQNDIALKSTRALTPAAPNGLAQDFGSPCSSKMRVMPVEGFAQGKYCVIMCGAYPNVRTALSTGMVSEHDSHVLMEQYLSQTQPGDVVTAGLFIGDYLPHFSNLVGPRNRVYGFEPNPYYMLAAQGTIFESGLSNVYTSPAGLSNAPGPLEFEAQRLCNDVQATLVKTTVVTIDDVLPRDRRVSLIHLGVEGYELEALQGAVLTLQHWQPIVVIECDEECHDISKFLDNIGYSKVAKACTSYGSSQSGPNPVWMQFFKVNN